MRGGMFRKTGDYSHTIDVVRQSFKAAVHVVEVISLCGVAAAAEMG